MAYQLTSEGQRDAIEALGIDESDFHDLVRECMDALESRMQETYEVPSSPTGFLFRSRQSSNVLWAATDKIMKETGWDVYDATEFAFYQFSAIRDRAREIGAKEALHELGHKHDHREMMLKINEWAANGRDRMNPPDITYEESMLPVNSVVNAIGMRGYAQSLQDKRAMEQELFMSKQAANEEIFNAKQNLQQGELKVLKRDVSAIQRSLHVQVKLAIINRKSEAKYRKDYERINNRLDKVIQKASKDIERKSQQTKFEQFWMSKEGQKRRDMIIRQGAMMSLGARRHLGMTNRNQPSNDDIKAAEKAFQVALEKGSYSKSAALGAIHDSIRVGVYQGYRKQGFDHQESAKLTSENKPRPSTVYKNLTGERLTVKEIEKAFESMSSKDIEQQLITDSDRKAFREARAEVQKELKSINEFEFDATQNPGFITDKDREKVRSQDRSWDCFDYIKTEKPRDKDLEDMQKPEKQQVVEDLKETKSKLKGSFGFGYDNLKNQDYQGLIEDRAKHGESYRGRESTREELEAMEKYNEKQRKARERQELENEKNKDQGLKPKGEDD